jgi:choline dehydrogenase-like flavoprotein
MSGIGPADHLVSLGIPVSLDLPDVGCHLQDHLLLAGVAYGARRDVPTSHYNHADALLYVPRGNPNDYDRPDLLLAEPADLDVLVQGVMLAREIGAAAAFADWRKRDIYPGSNALSATDLHQFIRRAANSFHHPVGTCRIGSVVDESLRAKGVAGLRVIDASVIPEIPQAMVNAATIAVAERASDLVLAG